MDGRPDDRERGDVEFVANFLTAEEPVVAWAQRREEEGWHALGCADHFFSPNRAYPHLWVTLATFAAATSRVVLTSSFANNLFRSPIEFAQAALQMQAVSNGRFEAGLEQGGTRRRPWPRASTTRLPASGPRGTPRRSRSCAGC